MPISQFLHSAAGQPHPVLRKWEFKRKQPGVTKLTCKFVRERDGLTFRPAELHVYFVNNNNQDVAEPDDQLWDHRLDRWLIENRVKTESIDNEAERFGFSLNHRFSGATERYGDGYFNAVLFRLLTTNDLGKLPAISNNLAKIHEYQPARGQHANDCQTMIEAAIGSVGTDLTQCLGYDDPTATLILDAAIAYYLDERYSISNRQLLGWQLVATRIRDAQTTPKYHPFTLHDCARYHPCYGAV